MSHEKYLTWKSTETSPSNTTWEIRSLGGLGQRYKNALGEIGDENTHKNCSVRTGRTDPIRDRNILRREKETARYPLVRDEDWIVCRVRPRVRGGGSCSSEQNCSRGKCVHFSLQSIELKSSRFHGNVHMREQGMSNKLNKTGVSFTTSLLKRMSLKFEVF